MLLRSNRGKPWALSKLGLALVAALVTCSFTGCAGMLDRSLYRGGIGGRCSLGFLGDARTLLSLNTLGDGTTDSVGGRCVIVFDSDGCTGGIAGGTTVDVGSCLGCAELAASVGSFCGKLGSRSTCWEIVAMSLSAL